MKKLLITFSLISAALLGLISCGTDIKPEPANKNISWTEAPSLKEAYVDTGLFEHIGFAVPAMNLGKANIQNGLKHHATSVTLENEFKPDAIMKNFSGGIGAAAMEPFTSTKGITIDVPKQNKLNFTTVDQALLECLDMGIKMRGHVLVWHSQTPKAFFCEDFNSGKPLVNADVMEARQEWYIKSVLEHVKQWEERVTNGEHIIYAWDVVNEALSDNANSINYLRDGGSSNWFKIFKNDEYIINAFRYANKYAPKDVLLCYNDYNEFQGDKHLGYLKILDAVIAHRNDSELPTRIDVAGMQSHNQTGWPSPAEYEACIRHFIEKGLDVQITELDITGSWKGGNNFDRPKTEVQAKTYAAYFNIYQKLRKTEGKHGVTGITFWGINDEISWRAMATPLIFSNYKTKDAFWAVLNACEGAVISNQ